MSAFAPTDPALRYLYVPVPPRPDALGVAWLYPAPRNIALASLGYLALYRWLDEQPDIAVRALASDRLAQERVPEPLLGLSFSFELDILGILDALSALGLPLYAHQRDDSQPLVFAGGPVAMANPEPYAAVFDFFVIGDGEAVLPGLVDTVRQLPTAMPRQEKLLSLARQVPGIYVPSLYEVSYTAPDGPIAAITPRAEGLPYPVQRQTVVMDEAVLTTPILSGEAMFSDTFLIEVVRGCAHRCRFCLASYTALPRRAPSLAPILQAIELGLSHTRKLGLLGALIADHPDFAEICTHLRQQALTHPDIQVSAASLRADTLSVDVAQTFAACHQKQLTIAIESGSEGLRRRINKHLKTEAIHQAAANVAEAGMAGLKLYGMVGLPTETEADVSALAELVLALKQANPRLKLTLGCSSFVPKAFTPFQWQARLPVGMLEKRQRQLQKRLAGKVNFRPSSPGWDTVQAVLARGDRRLMPVIERYWRLGGTLGSLRRAYKEALSEGYVLPTADWYAERGRPEDEPLPWDVLHLGVSKAILWQEAAQSLQLRPATL